jgi:hypothetical protein
VTLHIRALLYRTHSHLAHVPQYTHTYTFVCMTSDFSGLVVSMLASGTQVCGFKPGWSRRIFQAKKILSMPSFGREVKPSVPCRSFAACKRSVHLPWKSHAVGKIESAMSHPYFLPSLIEVSHVTGRGAPLEMTGETKSGAHRARLFGLGASGLQGPGSAPTLLLLLLLQRMTLYH